MIKWLNEIIFKFRDCFSRTASFHWFAIVIIWFMIRRDFQGLTGAIRDLFISPHLYTSLLNFFHAKSWSIQIIVKKWVQIVKESGCLAKKDGYYILLGDGIKKGKEGKRIPAVKKHHQESENTTKPTYIFGHLFGVVGLLIGNETKKFCLPVSAQIQNGANTIRDFGQREKNVDSHVVQMVKQCCQIAEILQEPVISVLDRYFLTKNALETLQNFQKENPSNQVAILTRAKSSAVAHEKPIPKDKKGRGRPAEMGYKVKLNDLFKTKSQDFQSAKIVLYEKEVEVEYLCMNLLYNKNTQLRYVLVNYEGKKAILVCSDLSLNPITIIELYASRQKIEATFKSLNQTMGGFDYHFWNKDIPKLDRYRKKDDVDPVANIRDEKVQKSIQTTLKAIEGYVTMACIANGLLQMLSILFSKELTLSSLRWLRTPSVSTPSEATVSDFLQRNIQLEFFSLSPLTSFFTIIQIIRSKQFFNFKRRAS